MKGQDVTHERHTFAGMHAEHRQWQSEHSMWTDDIELWRAQHEAALSQLKQLEDLLRQHGEALDEHAEATQRLQHSLEGHEKSMAAYWREGADAEGQEAMIALHRQEAKRHAEQREAHERIKKQQHSIITHLTMLKTALEAAK